MTNQPMTSMKRVLTTLGHQEPDRVPFFLLLTMHGAKLLNLSIKEYFAQPEKVAEGQVKLRERYLHDCYYNFHYASVEIAAFGGEVIFREDGPANSGTPFITSPQEIDELRLPELLDCQSIQNVIETTRLLKQEGDANVPIIGVVMSPFSIPVMQMGFDNYLNLLHEDRSRFWKLMQINQQFCIEYANLQLAAGATAICYFDPISSTTIIPEKLYRQTGWRIAKETLTKIQGPIAVHLASGRSLPIVDDIVNTGATVLGTSVDEPLADIKKKCKNKIAVLGNLNGVEMCRWTVEEARAIVKQTIADGGEGGGFILADNHGEIPFQVQDEVLLAISETVREFGVYPLTAGKK